MTPLRQRMMEDLQLRGQAGKNQVPDARVGMAQSIGGSGATVITTILESMD